MQDTFLGSWCNSFERLQQICVSIFLFAFQIGRSNAFETCPQESCFIRMCAGQHSESLTGWQWAGKHGLFFFFFFLFQVKEGQHLCFLSCFWRI